MKESDWLSSNGLLGKGDSVREDVFQRYPSDRRDTGVSLCFHGPSRVKRLEIRKRTGQPLD